MIFHGWVLIFICFNSELLVLFFHKFSVLFLLSSCRMASIFLHSVFFIFGPDFLLFLTVSSFDSIFYLLSSFFMMSYCLLSSCILASIFLYSGFFDFFGAHADYIWFKSVQLLVIFVLLFPVFFDFPWVGPNVHLF